MTTKTNCTHAATEEIWIDKKAGATGIICRTCGEMVTRSDPKPTKQIHGQRWEDCPKCGTEPVCNDCGYCARHCTCANDAEIQRQVNEIEREEPGFWRKYTEHMEQGSQEH